MMVAVDRENGFKIHLQAELVLFATKGFSDMSEQQCTTMSGNIIAIMWYERNSLRNTFHVRTKPVF
jgi:hypothetical protein